MSTVKESEQLTKLEDNIHVLKRPDTYMGSLAHEEETRLTIDEKGVAAERKYRFSSALMKIVDEILNNAVDQKIRMELATDSSSSDLVRGVSIKIDDDGTITVTNSGRGIPIIKDDDGIWKPQKVFSDKNYGSSFNDEEGKLRYTGGRNGIGAYLVNVCSKHFTILTVWEGIEYSQRFEDNLNKINTPNIIYNTTRSPLTSVKFLPDYAHFDNSTPDEIRELLQIRAYEMKVLFDDNGLDVLINGKQPRVTSFLQLVNKFTKNYEYFESGKLHGIETSTIRGWKFAIWVSNDPIQISFVNGINTFEGGKHVNGILSRVVAKMKPLLPKDVTIGKNSTFSEQAVAKMLSICLISFIPNPTFKSQTKTFLTLSSKLINFPEIPDDFVKNVYYNGKFEEVLKRMAKSKLKIAEMSEIDKKIASKFSLSYDKADEAGKTKAHLCTLIIAEGKSAYSPLTASKHALGPDGAKFYGIAGIRGKVLNPRKSAERTYIENVILYNLSTLIGLKIGKKYDTVQELKYGKVMVAADADPDGFHICGLILNFFEYYWPELLKIHGFLSFFRTPYVKCWLNSGAPLEFYSESKYLEWTVKGNIAKQVKFYKGLGTSTEEEHREYFEKLTQNQVIFTIDKDLDYNSRFDIIFGNETSSRKKWMDESDCDPQPVTDNPVQITKYLDNNVKIHSIYNRSRNIPSIYDGLKPCQRKILAGMIAMKIPKEGNKVAAIATEVSKLMEYHHGETSLCEAIVLMAQDFVGTNMVPYCKKLGSFGTRIEHTASSPRYIYSSLTELAKLLIGTTEPTITDYHVSEDQKSKLEPINYFFPVPMVLINGSSGIGTGWSTKIYKYHPTEVCKYLLAHINKTEIRPTINPYYHGFRGEIEKVDEKTFNVCGSWELSGNVFRVTEILPWIDILTYQAHLDDMEKLGVVRSHSKIIDGDKKKTTRFINFAFEIVLSSDYLKKVSTVGGSEEDTHYDYRTKEMLEKEKDVGIKLSFNIWSDFRLKAKCTTNNMRLFDSNGKFCEFKTVTEIIDDFITGTEKYYVKLYNYRVSRLEYELRKSRSKQKFIEGVAKDKAIAILQRTYDEIAIDIEKYSSEIIKDNGTYGYLTEMQIRSLTMDRADELQVELDKNAKKLEDLKKQNHLLLWEEDIKNFHKMAIRQ